MKTYIIFDLEWNQSPGGKEDSLERMPFEIIELGAVKLDHSLRPISEFHRLITPQVYTRLHYKISEVTHMDIRELKAEGESFPEVVRDFLQWCGEDCWFCTWGSMDLTELQRNMAYHHVEIPFERPLCYYDVQKLHALVKGDAKDKVSLDRAVEELSIPQDRPFHRAPDDAYYTGKVLQKMDRAVWEPYLSVDYYWVPEKKSQEFTLRFPTYTKYVSRTFETKEDALKDKHGAELACPQCGKLLRKKVRWFSLNQKQYFCLGICPIHGYVRGKIRMKKAEDGQIYAVKTIKVTDEDGAAQVFRKKEEQRSKRHIRHSEKRIKKREGVR